MSSRGSSNVMENPYARASRWNNRVYVRILTWLAGCVAWLAQHWRGKRRGRIEDASRSLNNLALYIDQPGIARQMADEDLLRRVVIETAFLTVFLTLVIVWTLLSVYGFVIVSLLIVFPLVIVSSFLFTHLLYLLALSGDVYVRKPDEAQRQASYQASFTTLRVAAVCLIALTLCLAFMSAWRVWVAIDLGLLILLLRVVYLTRLAQLRWSLIGELSLIDEN